VTVNLAEEEECVSLIISYFNGMQQATVKNKINTKNRKVLGKVYESEKNILFHGNR
jgi:hypothetical protein